MKYYPIISILLLLSIHLYPNEYSPNQMDSIQAEKMSKEVFENVTGLFSKNKYEEGIKELEVAAQKFKEAGYIEKYLEQFEGIFYALVRTGNQTAYFDYISEIESYKEYTYIYMLVYYRPMAVIYKDLENTKKSLHYYDKVITGFEELKQINENEKAAILTEVANIHRDIGEVSKSIDYYNKILNILDNNITDNFQYVTTYFSLGKLYSKMGNNKVAIKYFFKALDSSRKKTDNGYAIEKYIVDIYNYLSKISIKNGEYLNSKKYLNCITNNQIETFASGPGVLKNYAITYEKLGELQLAKEYFEKSIILKKIKSKGKPSALIGYYRDYGNFYLQQEKLDTALQYYQKGIASLVIGFDDTCGIYDTPQNVDNILREHILLEVLLKKGDVLYQMYEKNDDIKALEASLETYQLADQLIFKIRDGLQTPTSKQFLASNSVPVYEGGIKAALKLKEISGKEFYTYHAFDFTEKNKSILLLEALQDDEAKSLYLPDSLLDKEDDYKSQIAFYEKSIYQENAKPDNIDSLKIVNWQNILFDLKRNYEKFQTSLENDFPDYFNLKYNYQILGAEQIQQKLDKNTATIEYFVGDSTLYSFVLTQNSIDVVEIPKPKDFLNTINDYRKSVGDFYFFLDSTAVARKMYKESSDALYGYLLAEQMNKLAANIERLIIVPDDVLSLINFEALSDEQNHYLIQKYSVSYAYSLTHLFDKDNNVEYEGNKAIKYGGFAPKYKEEIANNADTLIDGKSLALRSFRTRGAIQDLPEARNAVTNIANNLNGDGWIANEATEKVFKENAHKYNILHLAMHGVTDNKNPLYSKLIFTQEQDTTEDNYLNVYELYNMKLKADLAVLSACNTGFGELKRGEGVMSMARGFAYAGCPSLIMSLWSVPSEETAQIMIDFYKELKIGKTKDNALRQAKLNYLKNANPERMHPFFWAGFIPIGNMNAIYQSPINYWKWIGILGISILFAFLFMILKKREG